MLRLDCHSKQLDNEHDLAGDVFFAHILHLSLPNHVHLLIPL